MDIDELLASITTAAESVRNIQATLTAALRVADELGEQFRFLGAGDKAAQVESVQRDLDDQQALTTVAAAGLERAQAQAESLRSARSDNSTGLPTASTAQRSFEPPVLSPARLLEALPEFKRRRGFSPRTHGTLQAGDGTRLEFVSGVDSSTPRIREHMWEHVGPVHPPRGFWSESHAELKAALAMNDNGGSGDQQSPWSVRR